MRWGCPWKSRRDTAPQERAAILLLGRRRDRVDRGGQRGAEQLFGALRRGGPFIECLCTGPDQIVHPLAEEHCRPEPSVVGHGSGGNAVLGILRSVLGSRA